MRRAVFMIRIIDRLTILAGMIAAILIGVAILLVCQMVFIRYVLVGSTAWQTEVVTFSLVASVLLGSAWVLKERGHVAVGIVTENAQPQAQRRLLILSDFVIAVFASIMTWKGGIITWEAFKGSWTSESIYEFPLWIPYLSMPVGFGLLLLQALALMVRAVRGEDLSGKRLH